ncbi:MAG: hypothetical protein UY20_C0003G0012 [Candidatus Yanofskybacteria bacterium GW2011_GWA1_48_10]|uniref:Uncharacterized protein n=1 Tax=Candidatus Yanofskybacteria bacterium GW2011_GWA1_48_10 TaxID=1619022 RepID=A0A0G1WI28_9BACT|nr:MAG: hypothetical protein UY20_C0003G0012 [Candidatus Yanofskybacteria bacterium GW2011_GWA1_48_10]
MAHKFFDPLRTHNPRRDPVPTFTARFRGIGGGYRRIWFFYDKRSGPSVLFPKTDLLGLLWRLDETINDFNEGGLPFPTGNSTTGRPRVRVAVLSKPTGDSGTLEISVPTWPGWLPLSANGSVFVRWHSSRSGMSANVPRKSRQLSLCRQAGLTARHSLFLTK